MHEICSVDSKDNLYSCSHQIFRLGFAPDPTGGAYSAPQTTYLDLRGPTSKEREGKERWREGEREEGECAVGIFNYFRLCRVTMKSVVKGLLHRT